MKKEVNFLTENSQDNDKQLSFKEQILRDLANARKEQQSPSHLDGFPPSEERNITETNKDFTNFDFKSVESAFGMPMRYANNSSHLVACLEKSKLMLDDIFQEKINFLLNGLFYADGEVKKSLFIEENMSVFFELKKCVYDAHIKSLNKI